uniref:Lysosome-associated membrane glycoprotein 3 isoform X2 n=1 Tax=Geotrypetes seraphini TaxID=260995 RepID=A0A6P8SC47_GEOSA|nr:lysosome-associated membrane glycoprotein 3 isoform X2 [Geotrypetes seraphini]
MDGFAALELILAFSAFVTCNFNTEAREKLESIQNSAEFLPSTNHTTLSTMTEMTVTTIYTTSNFIHHTHSIKPPSTAVITIGNTTHHNPSIVTTTPTANTTHSHVTGNTTQHNLSIATTTLTANTTHSHITGNTTQHNLSIATTTPTANTTRSHVTGNTTQHNLSIATTTPTANTTLSHVTGNTTQHNLSIATTTPTANTTHSHITGNTTPHNHSIVTTTPAANITVLTTRETVGPTLSPIPSPPPVLNYSVKWPNSSAICIQASMGLELIVLSSNKEQYFNIERDGTTSTGTCGEDKSNLNITFNKGFIGITFEKSEDSYYISEIEALLKLSPQGVLYYGKKTNQQLFKTWLGYSFKCASKQTVMLADSLQFRTIKTQLQAFSINDNKFGKVSECLADHNTVAIAVGLTVVILIVLSLIIYGIYIKRKSDGYQRI